MVIESGFSGSNETTCLSLSLSVLANATSEQGLQAPMSLFRFEAWDTRTEKLTIKSARQLSFSLRRK